MHIFARLKPLIELISYSHFIIQSPKSALDEVRYINPSIKSEVMILEFPQPIGTAKIIRLNLSP